LKISDLEDRDGFDDLTLEIPKMRRDTKRSRNFHWIWGLGLLSALTVSCSDGGSSSSGSLTVGVTDAPVDGADAVVIFFDAITVQSSGGSRKTYSVNDPVTGQPGRSVDLLQLTGIKSVVLLDNQQLSAGQYSWFRLDVDLDPSRSYIEIAGQRHELRCSSCDNNGLKLNRSFDVPADGAVAFTAEFDLRSSISNPQSGTYFNLRPTIRIVETTLAGNIAGTVDSTLISNLGGGEPCGVYVYEGGGATPNDIFLPETADPPQTWNNPISTASVEFNDSSYSYEVGFLPAGTYTTALTCKIQQDNPTMDDSEAVSFNGIDNVQVISGSTTSKDFI
jgi:hypothetical protein